MTFPTNDRSAERSVSASGSVAVLLYSVRLAAAVAGLGSFRFPIYPFPLQTDALLIYGSRILIRRQRRALRVLGSATTSLAAQA